MTMSLFIWSVRHYRGWQFTPLDLFVLVLVLSETVLVLEEKYWDVVDIRPKYLGSSFVETTIDLNRFQGFRVRLRARLPRCQVRKKPSVCPVKQQWSLAGESGIPAD